VELHIHSTMPLHGMVLNQERNKSSWRSNYLKHRENLCYFALLYSNFTIISHNLIPPFAPVSSFVVF